MPEKYKKYTVRLSEDEVNQLRRLYPHAGHNRILRSLVRWYLHRVEANADKLLALEESSHDESAHDDATRLD